MSEILEEIRRAWATIGVRLDQPIASGTYYRLLCAGCGRMIGHVGDRLLPGMAEDLVKQSVPLYAAGLLGCDCGHQREVIDQRPQPSAAPRQSRCAPRPTQEG